MDSIVHTPPERSMKGRGRTSVLPYLLVDGKIVAFGLPLNVQVSPQKLRGIYVLGLAA
jgi:hypothetical protein